MRRLSARLDLPQNQPEGEINGLPTYGSPITGEHNATVQRFSAAPRAGEMHQPHGLLRSGAAWPGDAGNRHSDVDPSFSERALGHSPRNAFAYCTVSYK